MATKKMVIPRPILTAQMPGVTMRELTVREQVERYLSRMRHTLALPCASDDLYFGLVPAAVREWQRGGYFETERPLPGRAANLMMTMNESPTLGMGTRALHVSAENQMDYLAASIGHRGHERIFWFIPPPSVPLPRNSKTDPFFLPADHPHYNALMDWVGEAYKIENEIQHSLKLIETYQAIVKSPAQVVKLWPELNNFISVKNGLPNNMTDGLRDKAARALRPTDKELLLEQLARAVMLPEYPTPVQAWVNFHMEHV